MAPVYYTELQEVNREGFVVVLLLFLERCVQVVHFAKGIMLTNISYMEEKLKLEHSSCQL